MRVTGRIISLACILIFISFTSLSHFSCTSVPSPEKPGDSLFVILCTGGEPDTDAIVLGKVRSITFSGPQTFSFHPSGDDEHLFSQRLIAGVYAISIEGNATPGILGASIDIQPKNVILFDFSLLLKGDILYAKRAGSTQQKRALSILTDHFAFSAWYGSSYAGFGTFRPKMFLSGDVYVFSIAGDPPGAQVKIDGDPVGSIPFETELKEGKYALEVAKDGFVGQKKLVSIEKNTRLDISLKKAPATVTQEQRKEFSIIILPFKNSGDDESNPYGYLFPGSLEVTLTENTRLAFARTEKSMDKAPSPWSIDFSFAEEIGADLLIAGEYYYLESTLFIHAVLYDVKSERIKYANTFESPAGLSIFNSIDRMAEEFSREVARVLPAPGEPIVEREEIMTEALISYEKKLHVDSLLKTRAARHHVFSLSGGLGAIFDNVAYQASAAIFNTTQRAKGPGAVVRLGYEYQFSKDFSYAVAAGVSFNQFSDNQGGVNIALPYVDFSLFTGPKIIFGTPRSDLYIMAGPCFTYGSRLDFTVDIYDNTIGPLYYLGLNIEAGYRFYFQDRASATPLFMTVGLMADLAEFRVGGDYGTIFVPFHFLIFIGAGICL